MAVPRISNPLALSVRLPSRCGVYHNAERELARLRTAGAGAVRMRILEPDGREVNERSSANSRESALAHTIGNKAEAAYRRGDALEKRRGMMEAWATGCEPKAAALNSSDRWGYSGATPLTSLGNDKAGIIAFRLCSPPFGAVLDGVSREWA
jgi:hypothetical protein